MRVLLKIFVVIGVCLSYGNEVNASIDVNEEEKIPQHMILKTVSPNAPKSDPDHASKNPDVVEADAVKKISRCPDLCEMLALLEGDDFIRELIIYGYDSDDERNDEPTFEPEPNGNLAEELEAFGPAVVSMIKADLGRRSFAHLLPHRKWIYGLVMVQNYLKDDSLEDLIKFEELRVLDLRHNYFSDPKLKVLGQLKHLKILDLDYNNIDPERMRELQAIRPDIKIICTYNIYSEHDE